MYNFGLSALGSNRRSAAEKEFCIRGGVKKKLVVLGGAHNKVAYPPPPQLWSNYHFFVGFFFA